MKFLIILLTSLFLVVGNASAEDYSVKGACKYYEDQIAFYYQAIARSTKIREEAFVNNDDETLRKHKKLIDKFKIFLKEEAKTYHYLDCSDFRE